MPYFDLQVNGYSGIDFNGTILDVDRLRAMCNRLASQGVSGIFATIITDSIPVMVMRLQRLARILGDNADLQGIIQGIHIEGPFINPSPGFRGAHPEDAIIPANITVMKQLLDAADGFTALVTLAPECDDGLRVTRMLTENNIVVSAGHTNASLDDLRASIDAGLTMFTHLGNGCPATMPRHDNIVQRALSLRESLWLCFIADGVHIPFYVLKNYLDLAGIDRSIVVTDAIVASDLGPGYHEFGRWKLTIGDDLVARSPDDSHFVGSTVTMPQSFTNLTESIGLSAHDALTLLEVNPRIALQKILRTSR